MDYLLLLRRSEYYHNLFKVKGFAGCCNMINVLIPKFCGIDLKNSKKFKSSGYE